MGQEFRVLVCCECNIFQVHQVCKGNRRWRCKICNTRQSVKQVFFRGTGRDSRTQCQNLNLKRHTKDINEHDLLTVCEQESDYNTETMDAKFPVANKETVNSKWDLFCDREVEAC